MSFDSLRSIKDAGKRGDWQQVLAWVEEYGTALFNHVYIGSAFVALKNSLTGDANREKDLKVRGTSSMIRS